MKDLEYHVGDLGHYHASKEKAIRFFKQKKDLIGSEYKKDHAEWEQKMA